MNTLMVKCPPGPYYGNEEDARRSNDAKLTHEQEKRAVWILLEYIPEDFWKSVREVMIQSPDNWVTQSHMSFGLTVRNVLRQHGFGDNESPTGNLDDVCGILMEKAAFSCQPPEH